MSNYVALGILFDKKFEDLGFRVKYKQESLDFGSLAGTAGKGESL